MTRRTWFASAVVTAVLGGSALLLTSNGSSPSSAADSPADSGDDAVHTATVTRGQLSTEHEFKASVSFGEPWTVNTVASGTVTQHREVGEIVRRGDTLLRIDDKPVTLAHGSMPMYRELRRVRSGERDQNGDRLELQHGADVLQLQAFLLDGGFDDGEGIDPGAEFGTKTEDAVEAWQESVGLPKTGRVDSSQIVFSPEPVRIAGTARVGSAFSGLAVNQAEPEVLIDTSNRDRGALPLGAEVTVTLPDDSKLTGTVVEQEQVVGADGSRIWRTTIHASGELPGDATSAEVTVIDVVADDVLIVPVGALLALAEGGFAVEIPTETGSRLVGVNVGEVIDGQAEISGGITVGDQVVIPS